MYLAGFLQHSKPIPRHENSAMAGSLFTVHRGILDITIRLHEKRSRLVQAIVRRNCDDNSVLYNSKYEGGHRGCQFCEH